MANVSAVCTSFKKELLNGDHAFGLPPVRTPAAVDQFKLALVVPTGNAGPALANYSALAGEVADTGDYLEGGKDLVWIAPSSAGGTSGYTTPNAPVVWTGVNIPAVDCAFIYNFTQGGKAVAAYKFLEQSVNGNFTLTMPNNTAALGLLRVA